MNKTAIEWCDYTWSPVTGCLYGCEYCYAEQIINRFSGHWSDELLRHLGGNGALHEINAPMFKHTSGKNRDIPVHDIIAPYPYGNDPTFHRYRLNEPQKLEKQSNIFVVSMGDLFGDWVPSEWINSILWDACGKGEQHRYLFLTKNPKRYREFIHSYLDYRVNHWYGTTVTSTADFVRPCRTYELHMLKYETKANIFLSIEPLQAEIIGVGLANLKLFDWIIIGAETGNRKDKIIPKREWIQNIVEQCHAANVPVFMKNSLTDIWGEPLIQEFPWVRG